MCIRDSPGKLRVGAVPLVQRPGYLVQVTADPAVFGGQIPNSGKQLVVYGDVYKRQAASSAEITIAVSTGSGRYPIKPVPQGRRMIIDNPATIPISCVFA